MFKYLSKFFSSVFNKPTHYSLESFLSDKNVNSTSELEYWIRQYDQKHKNGII
jgi:GH25 family lysozyme M1 (1,4-beta-N-acetylmuramidase)